MLFFAENNVQGLSCFFPHISNSLVVSIAFKVIVFSSVGDNLIVQFPGTVAFAEHRRPPNTANNRR